MPSLIVPLVFNIGLWLVFGVLSLPESHAEFNHMRYAEQTPAQRVYGKWAAVFFLAACLFGGCLIASYTPAFNQVCH